MRGDNVKRSSKIQWLNTTHPLVQLCENRVIRHHHCHHARANEHRHDNVGYESGDGEKGFH
jgi:hypothetical protein